MATRFLAFTCEKCAGNAFDDPPVNGIYTCSYCGTRHILVDNNLKKTEELQQNNFFGAADGFMELKKYHYAKKTFYRILEDWPNQSRAWWGLVICTTERFTNINLSYDEYNNVLDYAENAIQFASPSEVEILQHQWDEYSSKVKQNLANQERIRQDEARKQAEKIAAEERAKAAHNAEIAHKQAIEKEKQKEFERFKEIKRKNYNHKENTLKGTILAISISTFIIINIIYIIVAFAMDIPNSINRSPDCIAPIIGLGLISMVVSGICSGLFNVPPCSFTPAIINAICVIAMIVGMLSHAKDIFMGAMVIICFGAVGLGVTALIGWLGNLIGNAISKSGNAATYAHNKCNKEYQAEIEKKKLELGL